MPSNRIEPDDPRWKNYKACRYCGSKDGEPCIDMRSAHTGDRFIIAYPHYRRKRK